LAARLLLTKPFPLLTSTIFSSRRPKTQHTRSTRSWRIIVPAQRRRLMGIARRQGLSLPVLWTSSISPWRRVLPSQRAGSLAGSRGEEKT
jgi:hypothetical protein